MTTKHTVACFLLFFFSISFFPVTAQSATGFTGRVVEASSPTTGIANLWVDVFDCTSPNPSYTNGWIAGDSTDSNGNYTINVPTPGSYKIASLHLANTGYLDNWYDKDIPLGTADCVPVSNEQIVQLQDIALTPAENGSISGVVTSAVDNSNIANVIVYAYDSTGVAGVATTVSDGTYKITGLLPGNYTVYFGAFYTPYTSEWYDDKLAQNEANPVPVVALADTPTNAQLALGGTISGKVTYKETGAAIAGAWVDVCDDSTITVCNSSSPTWRGFAITDADGVYTVQGLPSPGTYKVHFHEKNTSYSGVGISEFYNDKRNISSADSVSVNSTNIDAALQDNPNLTQVYEVLLRKKTCHYVAINGKTVSVCQ
ncbi:carboxypeptidase regulatory-like domain-containing protein [Candidatus Electronema sp. PJ]|uniref:carboxypeptidase regulatory-like domain-containing protein n=1 Tax=Candidatus Electronema sp. PJ TaxID=3401572 RepID=UPI003AA8C5AC